MFFSLGHQSEKDGDIGVGLASCMLVMARPEQYSLTVQVSELVSLARGDLLCDAVHDLCVKG